MAYHLKTRIAIAVSLLTMVIMLLISAIAHTYFEKEFKKTSLNYIADALSITADSLSLKAHQSLHTLELIRDSIPYHALSNPVEMQHFLDSLHTEKLVFDNGIILFSPEGKLLAVNPRQEDVLGMDFSFRDYIKVTRLNKQPYISTPMKSRQKHHHPIVMLTEPVLNDNNEIVAILGGSLDLYGSNFLQALMNSKIGDSGYYIMLDQQETLLVHPDKENILRHASDFFPREQLIEFLLNSQGVVSQVTIDGQKMIGAFQHISPLNWTLVALTPLTEAYKPIQQTRIYTLMALAGLFVLIIFVVRRLTNMLISPLTGLTEEVRQLASSDELSIEFKSGPYEELGTLSKSIKAMVTELGQKRKTLNEQLSFLQNLVDTIPGPIFYKDAEYRYIGCNKAFEAYLGIPKDNLIGKSVFEIAPPEQANVYHKSDVELWEQGGEQVYEANVKYADGSLHDVIFYKKVFNDTEGNPAGMIGTFLDITDRKKSEQALKTSEQRFRLLVENAADAFFLHDIDGQVIDVNQQACISTGYNRDELLNMTVPEISADYNLDEVKQLQKRLKDEHILSLEDRHRRKDGSCFPVEVRLCYTEEQGGMIIALARDITERKHYESKLQNALIDAQAAKEQIDNILRSAADGIVVTNRRKHITHMNQIAEKMIGVIAEEVIDKPFTTLFSNKSLREQARNFLKEDGLDNHQIDFKLNLSDSKTPRIIQARSATLLSDDGLRSGVVTLLRDVSRERELDQLKSEFISTAAHEMRTPISVIMGYIEILSDREKFGGFSENQEKMFLAEAYSKGEALAKIIDDLFDISRMESGLPLPIEKRECDLNKIIESVCSHYANSTEKHVFKIKLEQSAQVMADTNKMTQVFENLISNAVKYSPEGGEILIKSNTEGNFLHIVVEDHGKGMTQEQLDRIFDKFYRADTSNTAVTGLGLGMSIVKSIIEGHGGYIQIESNPGEGTHVSLRIPLHIN